MSNILSWDSFLVVSCWFCCAGKNLLKSADAAGVVVVDENDAGLEKKGQIFIFREIAIA